MLNWSERLHGLLIPEGVVHRVRHGTTVLWTSIRRSIRSTLGLRHRFHAQPRPAETAPAEGHWDGVIAPQAEETALASSPANGGETVAVHPQGQAHTKAIDRGMSLVRCGVEESAGANAGRSAPAERMHRLDAKITGAAHGPGAVPAQSEAANSIRYTVTGHDPAAEPARTEEQIQCQSHGDGIGADSTPAEALTRAVPLPHGEAVSRAAKDAVSGLPPLMSILAEPRAAEGWEYPRKTGHYMVLNRVAGAVLYDARSGGKGLEVS